MLNDRARDILQGWLKQWKGERDRLNDLIEAATGVLDQVPDNGPVPPPPKAPGPIEPVTKGSTSGLPPITRLQAQVFRACEKITGSGNIGTQNAIARECGHTEGAYIISHLEALERNGYIRNMGQPRKPNWQPIVEGEVAIKELTQHIPKTEYAPRPRPGPGPSNPPPVHQMTGPLSRRTATDRIPAGATTVTEALIGQDGNGGRASPADSTRIQASAYLIRKGHTCSKTSAGWIVDGKMMAPWETLELVNQHREKAELAPVTIHDLE